jgi:hypothetical protein
MKKQLQKYRAIVEVPFDFFTTTKRKAQRRGEGYAYFLKGRLIKVKKF